MTQVADAPAVTAREIAMENAHRFSTDWRRWLQLGLAAIWVFDGLLQCQTYMFTKDFATQILAPTADGNPGWIAASIHWSADIVAADPVLTNAAFATLQLAIGLAIAWRRSLKVGLAVSIVWSLLVWWFGEGLGGLLIPRRKHLRRGARRRASVPDPRDPALANCEIDGRLFRGDTADRTHCRKSRVGRGVGRSRGLEPRARKTSHRAPFTEWKMGWPTVNPAGWPG